MIKKEYDFFPPLNSDIQLSNVSDCKKPKSIKKKYLLVVLGALIVFPSLFFVGNHYNNILNAQNKINEQKAELKNIEQTKKLWGTQYSDAQDLLRQFGITSLDYTHENNIYIINTVFKDGRVVKREYDAQKDKNFAQLGVNNNYRITLELKSPGAQLVSWGVGDMIKQNSLDKNAFNEKFVNEYHYIVNRMAQVYLMTLQPDYAKASFNEKKLKEFKQNLPTWTNEIAPLLLHNLVHRIASYDSYYYTSDSASVMANDISMLKALGFNIENNDICELFKMPAMDDVDVSVVKDLIKDKDFSFQCKGQSVMEYYLSHGVEKGKLSDKINWGQGSTVKFTYNRLPLFLKGTNKDWKLLQDRIDKLPKIQSTDINGRDVTLDNNEFINQFSSELAEKLDN